ncbi:MAG: hypothetical protein F6K10_37850 [Moorea sp. SIO2B7]|nr:hypothetical protein [Moorena sp. SIO2B7]
MSSLSESSRTAISGEEIQLTRKPIGELSAIAGYAAPPNLLTSESQNDNRSAIFDLAAKVLEDPLLTQKLSDRVYELMLEDLRLQRERSKNYGSRFV